ncbi:MAG: DUF6249 domain-containing protein [Terriglobia bacterium]
MNGEFIGFTAVVLIFGGIPFAVLYTFYRIRKLRTDERLAAIGKGLPVSLEPDLPHPARSRRAGILLVATGIGIVLTFWLISLQEPDALVAAAFGVIPFALGVGFFIDATLVRRELQQST